MHKPPESIDTESILADLSAARAREEATRKILDLLVASREDQQPVFDAILENLTHLCNAPIAGLVLTDNKRKKYVLTASRGAAPEFVAAMQQDPPDLDPDRFAAARAIVEKRAIHVDDLSSPSLYGANERHRTVSTQTEGIRTALFVPLIWKDQSIGALGVWRREVKPFDAEEIALVETFAAQAVIAIENMRQFGEVQEKLKREQANREILEVISKSRDDETPVFNAIISSASLLCDAEAAAIMIANEEGTHLKLMAANISNATSSVGDEIPMRTGHTPAEAIRSGKAMHIHDLRETELYRNGEPIRVGLVDDDGLRTSLAIPMIQNGKAIGAIVVHRLHKVRPFSTGDVQLLEAFAAQAVIAIENVRQFQEVQSANAALQSQLDREKASGEVLAIISKSRDDYSPVFNTILENAAKLCDAPVAGLHLVNSERTHHRLTHVWGADPGLIEVGNAWELSRPLQVSTCIREARVIHTPDLKDDPLYEAGDPIRRHIVDVEGVRTFLSVPLVKDGMAFGCFNLNRPFVQPFSEADIQLLEIFADQAVIAIENVRQFKELEDLNTELGNRVDEQVSEIERMGRLKRFLPAAVADTVVSSGSEKLLTSHRALLGVLFCDIRGFTAFCETAEPEETIEVLQTYHREMGKLINAHGAGVDHRMGDGIMVLFNDPLPCEDPAGDAVRLAIAMRAKMSELGLTWKRMGYRLGFGVGVSLGYATVGMVGFEGRSDYTASGTAVNLASRLCDEANDGEILLSARAAIAVEDEYPSLSMGETVLKGIREPVDVFKLVVKD